MSRIPRELCFSHGGTTYQAILMDEHVACRVIYEEACILCGYQLGNLAFYTTDPFIFCAHTACLLHIRGYHEASRNIGSNPHHPPPMYRETGRDILSNPHHPPNTFYHPYQPTLPPHGNNYACNYHPVPNYSYYFPPNVPYNAQSPYPPNLHNHGHWNSASSSGTHGVGWHLMGRVVVTALGAFLEALFQTMLS